MEETIGYEALVSGEEWDSLEVVEWEEPAHSVTITHDAGKTKAAYGLRCETCGSIGSADPEDLASLLARFHHALETTVVEVGR